MNRRALLARIDRNRLILVALCALLVLAGGWLAYTAHVAPGTTTEERTVDSWTTDGEFHHAAEVQQDTDIYPEGTRLENRSAYFATVAPELDGTYVLRASGGEAVAVETDLRVEIRASDGGNTVLWERSDHLASVAGEAGDAPHRAGFSLDVRELRERIAATNDDLGVSPRTTEVTVVAETTVEGDDWSTTRTDELALDAAGGLYSVDERGDGTTSHGETETVAVQRDYGPIRDAGGPVLLLAGLAGLGTLGALRLRGAVPLDPVERAAVSHARRRRRFDDWISEGRVPPSDGRPVRMNSLADLVDVAIDSDRRVIESDGRFYVLLGDARYVFDPGATGSSGAGANPESRSGSSPTDGPADGIDSVDDERSDTPVRSDADPFDAPDLEDEDR